MEGETDIGCGQSAGENEQAAKGKASKKERNASMKWLEQNRGIVLLGIVLLIVAAYALMNILQEKPEVSIGEFHGGTAEGAGKVNFIIVYSDECKDCEVDSSFVLLLNKNGIKWDGQKVEASSEDGKNYIEELRITKLPVFLVDGASISEKMIVSSDNTLRMGRPAPLKELLTALTKMFPMEAKYDANSDIFLLQELNLDDGIHIDYLVDTNECKPENPQYLARVDMFVDPYDPYYLKSSEALQFYQSYYKGRMEFNYHYLPIGFSTKFRADIPIDNIENFAKYLVCADEQGFLTKAEDAFYGRYCALNDDNVLQPIERANCIDSNHFGFPLLGDETYIISKLDLNYNMQEFAECLWGFPAKKNADAMLAKQLHIYRTPAVVVNCKYIALANYIDRALCKLNPEMEHCQYYG